MTNTQFTKALAKLDMTPSSQAAANALGLSVRQVQRLASGENGVPTSIERLLDMYDRHGLPKEFR